MQPSQQNTLVPSHIHEDSASFVEMFSRARIDKTSERRISRAADHSKVSKQSNSSVGTKEVSTGGRLDQAQRIPVFSPSFVSGLQKIAKKQKDRVHCALPKDKPTGRKSSGAAPPSSQKRSEKRGSSNKRAPQQPQFATIDVTGSIPNSARKTSSKKASGGSSRQATGGKGGEAKTVSGQRMATRKGAPKRDSFYISSAVPTAARAPYNFSTVYQPLLMMPATKKESRRSERVNNKENAHPNAQSRLGKSGSISVSVAGMQPVHCFPSAGGLSGSAVGIPSLAPGGGGTTNSSISLQQQFQNLQEEKSAPRAFSGTSKGTKLNSTRNRTLAGTSSVAGMMAKLHTHTGETGGSSVNARKYGSTR